MHERKSRASRRLRKESRTSFWLIFYPPSSNDTLARSAKRIHTEPARGTLAAILFVGGVSLLGAVSGFSPFDGGSVFQRAGDIALAQEQAHSEPVYKNIQIATILSAARNIDPNPSRGGAEIDIVDGSALVSEDGPGGTGVDIMFKKPSKDQITLYIVREGDTLSAIAEMFDVSPNTIRWANNLTAKSTIQPGDSLLILPVEGLRHTVLSGDTVASIAKKYDADVSEILVFNGLDAGEALEKGSVITIPGGEMPASKVQKPSKTYAQGASGNASLKIGAFVRPVVGAVRTQGIHGYNAVDLGAPVGTPVRAAAAGKVILSRSGGWNGGYGSYIVIDHGNGTQTLYAHLSANSVGLGQFVSQGQTIGAVGSTGRSTGPHLHFEVRGGKNPF